MTREQKIQFIIDSIWHLEDAVVYSEMFEEYTDEKLDKEVEWYDYLWGK